MIATQNLCFRTVRADALGLNRIFPRRPGHWWQDRWLSHSCRCIDRTTLHPGAQASRWAPGCNEASHGAQWK